MWKSEGARSRVDTGEVRPEGRSVIRSLLEGRSDGQAPYDGPKPISKKCEEVGRNALLCPALFFFFFSDIYFYSEHASTQAAGPVDLTSGCSLTPCAEALNSQRDAAVTQTGRGQKSCDGCLRYL